MIVLDTRIGHPQLFEKNGIKKHCFCEKFDY